MYRDKSLIPTEAIRLVALGTLADRPTPYADLALDVRHFSSRIMGPSLDMLGPSIELLRHEGLATGAAGPDAVLTITEKGRTELLHLLQANVRVPIDDLNKLVIAAKFRFLHVLSAAAQQQQLRNLVDLFAGEEARLDDLRAHHADGSADLIAWLDHELDLVRRRMAWLAERSGGQG